jgi:AcrR family transcriptional regulator
MKNAKSGIERRNEILDIAQEIFIRKGYEKTSVSDVVKTVGIAQGTFYYYFKSKEELLTAILERFAEHMAEAVSKIVHSEDYEVGLKIFLIIREIMTFEKGRENIIEYVHRNENREMHKKIAEKVIAKMIPLMVEVVEQGNKKNIFNVKHPYEVVSIMLPGIGLYIHESLDEMSQSEVYEKKISALEYVIKRMLNWESSEISLLRIKG